MTKEEIEQAEKFLDAYLGGNRNVSTLTWKHWIECLADYGKKLQSENERLKAEREWISVEQRLPELDGNSQIKCIVLDTYNGIVVRPYNEYHKCWDDEDCDDFYCPATGGNITHWMPLPQPPKQPPKKPICCEKYMRCQDCPSSPNYINPLTSNKQ